MIFRVVMKDPYSLIDDVDEAIIEDLEKINLSYDEKELFRESRKADALNIASKWFEYSEYLTVEIDTEKETIRVVSNEDKRTGK